MRIYFGIYYSANETLIIRYIKYRYQQKNYNAICKLCWNFDFLTHK